MDNQYHWFDPDAMTRLNPGTWNQLTFTLPSAVSGQLRQLVYNSITLAWRLRTPMRLLMR